MMDCSTLRLSHVSLNSPVRAYDPNPCIPMLFKVHMSHGGISAEDVPSTTYRP